MLLTVLFTFLAIRASDEYRWSDWGFGDAQTMLSLRQWEEGGWFHNYFLFKPQGYAKAIDQLDDPELRHHAHGTCPGSSPRVGPRLLYTHYPAGYLIPYALLFKVGLDSLFAVRMLSICFSVGALALMYVLFAKITSPRLSFVAVLFYALSNAYLGYADSLANQPIDDLLRFGFMLAVVLATRAESLQRRNRWMLAAWVLEFCLSLTSFDSVFFIYAWLIGWDLLEKRGFQWKTYLLFSLAPVTAHSLQFLQNVWYLGWSDAFIDIKDAFLLKNGADQGYNLGQGRLSTIGMSLFILFNNLFNPGTLLLIAASVYAFYATLLRDKDREMPSLQLLLVLFLCGLSFIVVLPHAARMPYEARQMLPFVSLIAGGLTWSFLKLFKKTLHGEAGPEGSSSRSGNLWFAVPYVLLSAVVLLAFWFSFLSSDHTPVYELREQKEEMQFAKELNNLRTRYEPVYFDIGAFSIYWDPRYVPGYPQILPLTEYYAGSRAILCFNGADDLARDVNSMVHKSPDRFSPVLLSRDPAVFEPILAQLVQDGLITGVPEPVASMGRYALDLTDYIKWGDNENHSHSGKP